MGTLWFILVLSMLIMYVVLDGFDLGAEAIHLFTAKNEGERRTILRAIGPVWDGNEVWLIAAGGTLFFSFPVLYATSFSGFYLPLMIVLWLLMLRGVAIELRSHVPHPMWSSFWDVVFCFSSALLALFLGCAMGNVVRGVPINADGYFFEPLWTDFNPYSPSPGILDWYTVLVGLMAVSTLVMHGASYLVVKTLGSLNQQAWRTARAAWVVTLVLTILVTIATFSVRPGMFANFQGHPAGFVLPAIAIGSVLGFGVGAWRSREKTAFGCSSAFIASMMASAAFGAYPNVLPATIPGRSLNIWNAATSHYGQVVGLVWWCIGIGLAILYFVLIYRLFRGKVPTVESPPPLP